MVIGLWLLASVGAVDAQATEPTTDPPQSAHSPLAWDSLPPLPIEPKALAPDPNALCEDKPGGLTWIDRMHTDLYRSLCLTVAGFDGFFGNARFDDEYEATYGRLAVGSLWDQRDRWDPSIRFQLNAQLPQLSERFKVFVGRLNPDEYVTELRDDFDALPRQFGTPDDDAVLVGLGYRTPGPGGGHFDLGAGTRAGWPLKPYVKGSYRLTQPFLERNLLRLHETVFWREGDGFGTTMRLDLERLLTDDFLVRWTGSGTLTEATEGLRWYTNLTIYQNIGDGRALAYQAGISGETGNPVSLADFGLRVIYRRRIHLDWLFLELRSSVAWPRDTLAERRIPNWGLGVALEMQFGERT